MTSHATSHVDQTNQATESHKSTSQIELCPMFKSLEKFAAQKYDSYMTIAASFDDAQDQFTSKAVNFLHGNNLLAKVALRSAEIANQKA